MVCRWEKVVLTLNFNEERDMTFRIHFNIGEYEDSFVISADTTDEIREKAEEELAKRGGTDPWSEELGV